MRRSLPPFLLGFLSMALQIILLREFFVHFQGNEMTTGLLLAAWLFWGGLGSLLAHRLGAAAGRFQPLILFVLTIAPLCLTGLRLSRLALGILPAEMTGPTAMSAFALALAVLLGFPLGTAFVASVRAAGGDAAFVYSLESAGAAAGGLAVHFLLIPHLSNWQAAGAVGLAAWAALLVFSPGKSPPALKAAAAIASAAFFLADMPTQKLFWKPLELVASHDTPYGKLQAVRAGTDIALYVNGVPAYSSGDPSAAEDAVHFALLQRPRPEKALLLGGGAGGGLEEALKHPGLAVDYVELDPEIIGLSQRVLPAEKTAAFRNPRVAIRAMDGRAFLARQCGPYDAVLVSLPEPSTAQLNRFYTREFFELAARRLGPDGVLSLRLPSSENYISLPRARFLASLKRTMREVFPEVEIVPGEANVFLASRTPLTLDAERLSREAERRGLAVRHVRRELLEDRLHPLRREFLARSLAGEEGVLNTDLFPRGTAFALMMWAAHFKGPGGALLERLSRLSPPLIVSVPFSLGLLVFLLAGLRGGSRTNLLAPLALLGFSGISAEVLVLVRFQTLYGSAYGSLALLLASFMAGLWLGSLAGRRQSSASRKTLIADQVGLAALLGLASASLLARPPRFALFAILLVFGFLSGRLFVMANRLYIKGEKDHGTGYGLDLLGSFLGSAAVAAVFLPLAGLLPTALLLTGLNILALGYLLLVRLPA